MPPLLTSADIHTQKSTYSTTLCLYNEYNVVKLALRNQITDAVESDYLTTLINTVTDKIPNNIPAILIFLQTTYDRISPVELMQKEDDLKYFFYNPSKPIDTLFNHIDRLANLCELFQDPISDKHKVNVSYKII